MQNILLFIRTNTGIPIHYIVGKNQTNNNIRFGDKLSFRILKKCEILWMKISSIHLVCVVPYFHNPFNLLNAFQIIPHCWLMALLTKSQNSNNFETALGFIQTLQTSQELRVLSRSLSVYYHLLVSTSVYYCLLVSTSVY